MSFAAGKNTGTVLSHKHGSVVGQDAGSLLGRSPQKTSGLPPLTSAQVIKETQAIVLHFPTKVVAAQQEATPRAVEAQRNGESAMSLRAAVNMARANPRARAMLGRLLGFTGQYTDPDFMEGLEQVVGYMLRQQQLVEEGPAVACDAAMGDLFGGVH